MQASTSDDQFMEMVRAFGCSGTAKKLGINARTVFRRRASLEQRKKVSIERADLGVGKKEYPHRATLEVQDGVVIVAGDSHYWPGPASIMHKAVVAFCKEFKPRAIVFNGDVIDAPSASRHPPIGWEELPKLSDEIEAAIDRLHEIEKAAGRVEKLWNLGNHDTRFESRLALVAPEYARVKGVALVDHFPNWRHVLATWINNEIVIKHRFKGGLHAPHNNTLWAGKTMITGHLHSARVVPMTDYNGTRYGVDTGCIADMDHKAFVNYTEDNPLNWRSAFLMLTFKGGQLLMPELVFKWDDGSVQFRGKVIKV